MQGTTPPPHPHLWIMGPQMSISAEAEKTWDNLMNNKQPHIAKVQMLHWSKDTSGRPWKDGIAKLQSHSRNMRIR